jgi:hypothetical protein
MNKIVIQKSQYKDLDAINISEQHRINDVSTITLEVFTNSNDAKSSSDKLKIMRAKECY